MRRARVRLRNARAWGGYAAGLIGGASRLYFDDALQNALRGWAPGHFYSPLPSLDDVRRREAAIFAVPDMIPGVDLNEQAQLALLRTLAADFYADQPYDSAAPHPRLRYDPENPNFSLPEAILLHCMLRHARPRRIIEIGCGHSSAVILDTVENFLDDAVECTMIEPHPDLLRSLMQSGDERRIDLVERPLQEVDTDAFRQLQADDILFIDSTHVVKIDSDVNHLFARVLPSLTPGVRIHFHDIYYPFEYPRAWVLQGRAWTEAYMLRSFLQYNAAFRIELFTSWLAQQRGKELARLMPRCARPDQSSLWLRRV